LIEPNPVYDARRKLLDLVVLGSGDWFNGESEPRHSLNCKEADLQEDDNGQDNDF
jgi:hypothetical protein